MGVRERAAGKYPYSNAMATPFCIFMASENKRAEQD